uniref:Lipase n=1 Tax=Lygus lineolaris TaxID=50650 RepID=A0A286K5J8_LYGLI|nr:lipase 11 [Lygus lineolaris]
MIWTAAVVLTVCLAVGWASPSQRKPLQDAFQEDPDDAFNATLLYGSKAMVNLVLPQGYPLQAYEVKTADGYILTVFRIPYGKNGSSSSSRPPILLQHGIFATSASWVVSEPRKGLGFVLADEGYDVWISNSRGNTFSNKHVKYNRYFHKKQFYNFSWHEMGYYDLPAVIDFILQTTNHSQITYAGHSQGTTQFFVMGSTRPEYNAKVKVAALMAPIGYLDHTRGTARILKSFSGMLTNTFKVLGVHEVLTTNPLLRFLTASMCRETAITLSLCDDFLFALVGFDKQQFNMTLMPLIAQQGPSGASVKQLDHFGQQTHNGGKFTMYDYGRSTNRKVYGSSSPPEYDLSKITVPIHLHYSLNDWLAGVESVEKLHRHLPQSKLVEVPLPAFNHLDFMWAKDVRPLLYDNMIAMLKMHL